MRFPQTFILLAILLFLIQFIGATWITSEAEGAGGVKGGPYWNEDVYRDQQKAKSNQQRYDDVKYHQEVQQLHMNNVQMQRYREDTARKRRPSSTSYHKRVRQPSTSSSSWNYRRANE